MLRVAWSGPLGGVDRVFLASASSTGKVGGPKKAGLGGESANFHLLLRLSHLWPRCTYGLQLWGSVRPALETTGPWTTHAEALPALTAPRCVVFSGPRVERGAREGRGRAEEGAGDEAGVRAVTRGREPGKSWLMLLGSRMHRLC